MTISNSIHEEFFHKDGTTYYYFISKVESRSGIEYVAGISCTKPINDVDKVCFVETGPDLDALKSKAQEFLFANGIISEAISSMPNETDETPDCVYPGNDIFTANAEMDSEGRLAATLIEHVRADDVKLESIIDKITREVAENRHPKKGDTVQISSITNVIAGKTYVATINTADAGYCLMITGESENGLPKIYHKHFSLDINQLSREAMVLLHLSDPVHGEEFPVSNNDLMNLPGNALQPIATKAAARTFAALNPKKPVTVGFSFRIDADIKNEFCKYCDERNYNYSEVLRMLMSTFLQESWSQ